jgi:glycosidase
MFIALGNLRSVRRFPIVTTVAFATLICVVSGCGQSASSPSQVAAPAADTVPAPLAAAEAAPLLAVNDNVDDERRAEVRPVVQTAAQDTSRALSSPTVPSWAADAIFYQIFPERFCNGDRANDPTRDSLEFPDTVPPNWSISPWTGDWYARADWEKQQGANFYEHGVFNRRYGGDLQGVLDKLDYLATLGINTIYFNPVFYARSLHKYDGSSYHHIDPYFGPDPKGDLAMMSKETSDPGTWQWTEADKLFLELLRQAHAKNIRIIIDGVFNHTGRTFFAFADLIEKQDKSPYRDWYLVQSFDDGATPNSEFRYKGWWGVETLPEFANNEAGTDLHDGPKRYVFDSCTRWMDPNGDGDPADGIDGWRLDVANEVPIGFWRDWHAHIRKVNPDCYTVAEVWGDARKFLEEGQFSATMNYHGFAFPVKGFLIDKVLPPSGASHELNERLKAYSPPMRYALQNLMESHDTDRLASMIVNAGRRPYAKPDRFDYDEGVSPRYVPEYDVRKPNERERRIQRLVTLFQMTYVGPPMIYYGTECGMWGADDPCDRQPMVWPESKYDAQQADPLGRSRTTDPVVFDEGLFNFHRAAISLRRENPALRRGSIQFIATDDTADFLAFRRADDDQILLVGLNRGDAPFQWRVPLNHKQQVEQTFTASGAIDQFKIVSAPGEAVVTVPAIDGIVLRVSSKE